MANVTGDKEMIRRLKRLGRTYPDATAAALYQEGLALHRNAVARTPVDSGKLRQSAYVAPPKPYGRLRCIVGYGTNYGIYVHERTELRHPVGEAKFLERAFNEILVGYKDRLAKRIEANVLVSRGVNDVPASAPTQSREG